MKQTKVWLNEEQVNILEQSCERLKDRCIIQLGCWVGMRSEEIASVKVEDLREYTIDDDIKHFLKVEGKKTNQDEGQKLKKERMAFVPDRVYTDLIMLKNQMNLKADNPLIPNKFNGHYTPDGIQERVRAVREKAYNKTEDPDFKNVSSHDLRRFFAHYCLVEQGKNPRVVMDVGGWESWEALKPYLDKPSKKTTAKELEDLG